jgi:hypothetical protein
MKSVALIALCIALQTSIFIHIYCLVGYVSTKTMTYFRYFMITVATNVLFSIVIAMIVAVDPRILKGIKLDAVWFLEAGLIFTYFMAVKIRITWVIISRLKDPANYHLNHFGKKIYNTTIVNFREVMTYFVTFPFTLMAGAYFVVRIIQM